MLEGRWQDPAILAALLIEVFLLFSALVRREITKKGLAVIIAVILLYALLAAAIGRFSEIVVMALGGLAVYGAMMSRPKFPLTRRAMATGIVVAVIMTFLGIYLALKLGVVYFVGAEMLGAIFLSANGRYTKEENTVVVAIANGSSMVAIGVLITFPAIAIFEPAIAPSLITYPFIAFVTGTSAVFGLILLAPFRDRFEDEPWPQVRPQAQCIISLGEDAEAKRSVGKGLVASAAWVGATRSAEYATGADLSSLPHALEPIVPGAASVPNWIGIANSPLIAAIGFFVGWKRAAILAIGSLASFMVWLVLESAAPIAFGTHLSRPEILYLVLGVFATVILSDVLSGRGEGSSDRTEEEEEPETACQPEPVDEEVEQASQRTRMRRVREELFSVETLKYEIREMIRDPKEYLRTRRGQIPPWVAFLSLALYMIVGIIVFSLLRPFPGIEIHWLLFLLGTPLAMVSAYFTARAISETGMLAGYISDVVAIPAILFFRVSFQAITTFMSMLGALQDAAIALLVHLKLGKMTGVRGRDILKAVFIGVILGTFVGSLITYMIYITYGFGTAQFPSPAAQLFGFLVISLRGIGNFELPGVDQFPTLHPGIAFAYLLCFGLIGFLLGREVNKREMSAMSLAVGLLIPPATSVAILIGGFIDYKLKREKRAIPEDDQGAISHHENSRERYSRFLSGVVAGEAIVTVLWVFWSAIILFF
ncbi:hypothetical protein EU545_03800 [Candidatus Thorarchaeota archaeon]|nr:MAG: hypothetical protein EU545_03800 [Candidatus Thorarchaeota archaeon]